MKLIKLKNEDAYITREQVCPFCNISTALLRYNKIYNAVDAHQFCYQFGDDHIFDFVIDPNITSIDSISQITFSVFYKNFRFKEYKDFIQYGMNDNFSSDKNLFTAPKIDSTDKDFIKKLDNYIENYLLFR